MGMEDKLTKSIRQETLKGNTPKKTAERAIKNPYVFDDVLEDPSLVNADTQAEAVEFIAEVNPGWANLRGADIYEIAPDADLDTESEASAESGSSESEGGSEANSDADAGVGDAGTTSIGSDSDLAGVASGTIDTDAGEVDISANADSGANSGSGGGANG